MTTLLMLALGLFLVGCSSKVNKPEVAPESVVHDSVGAASLESPRAIAGVADVTGDPTARPMPPVGASVELDEATWQSLLTPEQFEILREAGTERAFDGELLDVRARGTFHCAACNAPLFESKTKFKSGTGWPSFYDAIRDRVASKPDYAYGMERTEVLCKSCGGHLGHVFQDGPAPTGLRYCVNSASLNFRPADAPELPEGLSPELKSTQ